MVIFISIGNNCNELSQMKNNRIIAHDIQKSKKADYSVREVQMGTGCGRHSAGAGTRSKKIFKSRCLFYSLKNDQKTSMQ